MAQKMFYVVVRRDDTKLFRHKTLQSAEKEAKRLANKYRDAFFILPAINAFKYNSVFVNYKESLYKKTVRSIVIFLLKLLDN